MAPKRNEPCTCGSGKKYKKCCSKWHKMGLPSPPRNGLPNDPRPPGRSLGIIGGGPKNVPFKERWMIEEEGNYIWYEEIWDELRQKIFERRGWYTVKRR